MEKQKAKNENVEDKKSESIRVGKEGRKVIDDLLTELNRSFGTRRISPARLVTLLPELLTDEHKKRLRAEVRKPEEKQEIWRSLYIKENGEISKRDFQDFMNDPEYATFLSRHKAEYRKLLLSA